MTARSCWVPSVAGEPTYADLYAAQFNSSLDEEAAA